MKNNSEELLLKEAQALKDMSDSEINYDDIPNDIIFHSSERGRFYRPIKHSITLRLDADLIEWFKSHHPKYQTAINAALRKHVQNEIKDAI